MALTDEDKQWLTEQFDRFATKADLEAMETKLLTAFHSWASPLEARVRTHAAAMRAVDLEMEYHEDRLKKLESGEQPPAH